MISSREETEIVVRQYGLLAPANWGPDVDDELYRMNKLWNTLVEIERENRDRYHSIIAKSTVLDQITAQVTTLEEERSQLIEERNRRRAAARSKTKADTADLDVRIKEIKDELNPIYAQRKILTAQAKEEQKPALQALEEERKSRVKQARQSSGLFWSNYNAVIDSYQVARVKVMKEGGELRFRRFNWEGRLVNQIQGGVTMENLLAGKHAQISMRLSGSMQGRRGRLGGQHGILTITAFTGRDDAGRFYRRNLEFPIILHRTFPEGALIKSVVVTIHRDSPTVVQAPSVGTNGPFLERGRPRFQVSFTCRVPTQPKMTSREAVGINIGWKKVAGGLRVATAVSSDGQTEHLVLPERFLKVQKRIQELKSVIDTGNNDLHVKLQKALKDFPIWEEEYPVHIEGLNEHDHRLLSAIKRAGKTPARCMETLAWRLKEDANLPFVSGLAKDIEQWRKIRKIRTLEMNGLRRRGQGQRKDLYRVFAKRCAERAYIAVLDATSYKEAAKVKRKDGEDPVFHEQARFQRVIASPFELRLSIEQAFAKFGGMTERYEGKINQCKACGQSNLTGDIERTCHSCGDTFDEDVNAAANLLASVKDEPGQQDTGQESPVPASAVVEHALPEA